MEEVKSNKIKPKLNRMMFLLRRELVGSSVGLFRNLSRQRQQQEKLPLDDGLIKREKMKGKKELRIFLTILYLLCG